MGDNAGAMAEASRVVLGGFELKDHGRLRP
jgi:hypothetical protein